MDENGGVQEVDETPKDPTMASKVTKFLGALAVFSYLLSLPVLAAGISLLYMRDYDCEDLLRMPRLRICIGVGMIVIFSVSNLVVYYGSRLLMPAILAVIILLLMMLTIGLALVGSYKMETQSVPASPMWLRARVENIDNWKNIKGCIHDSRICSDLSFRTLALNAYEFNKRKLSPIESGCCKPPSLCGMEYVNATFWNSASNDENQNEFASESRRTFGGDCDIWSNSENQLCYDCETCKEGFLRTIQRRWKHLGVFLVTMAVFHIVIHIIRFVVTMSEI